MLGVRVFVHQVDYNLYILKTLFSYMPVIFAAIGFENE